MAHIMVKPGITDKGFHTAVRDYTECKVVEELAANSYDADAKTVLVLLDESKDVLHVIDDGEGFSKQAVHRVPILGGGDKSSSDFSRGKRHYLGAYGFGLKSSINIAKSLKIQTSSEDGFFSGEIDWQILEKALAPDFEGFPFQQGSTKSFRGTWLELRLKTHSDRSLIERIVKHLSDLPEDDGKFKCYVGDLASFPGLKFDDVADLANKAKAGAKSGKCIHATSSSDSDLSACKATEDHEGTGATKIDLKFYFAGISDGKVNHLKRGLRGIYIRIHGRLLKHDFADREYTYNISKWMKFASGVRVEITADWLRNEITLARDSVRFTNEALKESFISSVQKGISKFIRGHLATLEKRANKDALRREDQREELARKRIRDDKSLRIQGLKNGFVFCPETDGELALVVAQPTVIEKIDPSLRLIDYNDQAPYDCMMWDAERDQPVRAELEPALTDFLQHRDSSRVELIVTWTLGKWRTGASKRGKEGTWKLLMDDGAKRGLYKLALLPRANGKKPPKRHVNVAVLEQLLGCEPAPPKAASKPSRRTKK